MEQLKKCPFCGGEAEVFKNEELGDFSGSNRYAVKCRSCFCGTGHYRDVNRAAEAWNTRRPMERVAERLGELRKSNLDMGKVCKSPPLKMAYLGRSAAYENAMEIVKEEMG